MSKELRVDVVNRIKSEDVNEFDDSIFSEVYQNATKAVKDIISLNEKYRDWKDCGIERFSNENYISNVISFLGERGMGKSSAMLSFAYYLKKFYKKEFIAGEKYKITSNNNLGFYVMSKIDAAMIGAGENLLDIVLAKMWDDYILKENNLEIDKYISEHIKGKFSEVKKLYGEYQNFSKNISQGVLAQNSNLSELHTLSRSINLRKIFSELIDCYLTSMDKEYRDNYLVICIDDLDIVKDCAYNILEQIRMFLTIPRVIILITADIDRLILDVSSLFSEKLLSDYTGEDEYIDMVRVYARDYLAKILPVNMRIYMPFLNAIDGEISIHKDEVFSLVYKDTKLISKIDENRFTKDVIAKYLGILLYPDNIAYPHTYKSLRDKINGISELKSILKEKNCNILMYEWMKKQILIGYNNIEVSQSFKSFIKRLLNTSNDRYNYVIINYLGDEYLERSGKLTYGYMLCELGQTREFINEENSQWMLIWLYSVLISKMLYEHKKEEIEQKIIKNDIFNSAISSSMQKTGWNCPRNVSPFFHMMLDNYISLEDIIHNNIKQIVEHFKVLLFYDIDFLIDNIVYDVEPIVDNKEIIEIKIKEIKEKASIDNFLRNIIDYNNKWERYLKTVCEIINIKEDLIKSDIESIVEKNMHIINTKQFIDWKKRYEVNDIFSLLPIQSFGIMLDIVNRLEKFTRYDRSITYDNFKKCIDIIIETLKTYEKEYEFDKIDRKDLEYSKKLEELLDIVNIDSISKERFDEFFIVSDDVPKAQISN